MAHSWFAPVRLTLLTKPGLSLTAVLPGFFQSVFLFFKTLLDGFFSFEVVILEHKSTPDPRVHFGPPTRRPRLEAISAYCAPEGVRLYRPIKIGGRLPKPKALCLFLSCRKRSPSPVPGTTPGPLTGPAFLHG